MLQLAIPFVEVVEPSKTTKSKKPKTGFRLYDNNRLYISDEAVDKYNLDVYGLDIINTKLNSG